jgi:hypothetical protein
MKSRRRVNSTVRRLILVKQRIPKVLTFMMGVFAFLLSPVLLLPAAFIYVVLAIFICPGVTAKPVVGCRDCDSNLCPWLLAIGLFVALPVAIVSAYLLRRRKASKP